MKMTPDEIQLKDALRSGFGDLPSPRFDEWCTRFPDAVSALEQMPCNSDSMDQPPMVDTGGIGSCTVR